MLPTFTVKYKPSVAILAQASLTQTIFAKLASSAHCQLTFGIVSGLVSTKLLCLQAGHSDFTDSVKVSRMVALTSRGAYTPSQMKGLTQVSLNSKCEQDLCSVFITQGGLTGTGKFHTREDCPTLNRSSARQFTLCSQCCKPKKSAKSLRV